MTKAPEKIWLWHDGDRTFVSTPDEPYPGDAVEYTRTDLRLALVAAAYEDAKNAAITAKSNYAAPTARIDIANAIGTLTPDDAQAALERVKREARNEALREAADIAERWGDPDIQTEILALMEDKK